MHTQSNKEHWEKIYATKQPHEVSWTQENPKTSLEFIHNFRLPKDASIIDVGGGESKLVDQLLAEGYTDITVLDISEHAIARARQRLGAKADGVKWIVADITQFQSDRVYDLWHDRATFHFMTTVGQISDYLGRARKYLRIGGLMTVGTFSELGPKKCSGLEIRQYSEQTLEAQLDGGFQKIKCITEDHHTPFNTIQNFLFCSFRRLAA